MYSRREVDIGVFVSQLWPRMIGHKSWAGDTQAKKKAGKKGQTVERALSGSAVFAEIFSIIKGSWEALDTASGFLSLQQYLQLPAKLGAVAGAYEVRQEMYDLFLSYQALKKEQHLFDLCDVVFAAHSSLMVRS